MLRILLARALAADIQREIELGLPADWQEVYEDLHDSLLDFADLHDAQEAVD